MASTPVNPWSMNAVCARARALCFFSDLARCRWLFSPVIPNPSKASPSCFFSRWGFGLGLDHRFSPSMILGALATRSQRPEWVSLEPKKWAWGLGFASGSFHLLSRGLGQSRGKCDDGRLLGMPRPTFRRERAGDMCGVLPLHPGAQDKAFALRRRYLRLHAAFTAFAFF